MRLKRGYQIPRRKVVPLVVVVVVMVMLMGTAVVTHDGVEIALGRVTSIVEQLAQFWVALHERAHPRVRVHDALHDLRVVHHVLDHRVIHHPGGSRDNREQFRKHEHRRRTVDV